MNRRVVLVASMLAGAILAGGCATQSSDATQVAVDALREPTTTTVPSPPTTEPPQCNPLASLPAMPALPTPGNMPDGTFMHDIQEAGVLVVGVDENTPHLGERDPATGTMRGLEIDLVKAIAGAITGNPEAVEFKTVVTKEKNQVVADGDVDLTASADSMTCPRWTLVDFSTEYLTTHQNLLVRDDSKIFGVADLAGRPVCVTEGSSSVALLDEIAPTARHVEVPARNDCLVALQLGNADAYLGHDTFIRGMNEQDPDNTRIVREPNREQHYGIAISKDHPEMVSFVNAVLEQMRADGRLAELYTKWLEDPPPAIPDPVYTS
jgi:polar amino acid transport system substrate-binding protein